MYIKKTARVGMKIKGEVLKKPLPDRSAASYINFYVQAR